MFSKQQNATGTEHWKVSVKEENAVWSCGEWKSNWNVSVFSSENRGINITFSMNTFFFCDLFMVYIPACKQQRSIV
jgi:hypothetical protein